MCVVDIMKMFGPKSVIVMTLVLHALNLAICEGVGTIKSIGCTKRHSWNTNDQVGHLKRGVCKMGAHVLPPPPRPFFIVIYIFEAV